MTSTPRSDRSGRSVRSVVVALVLFGTVLFAPRTAAAQAPAQEESKFRATVYAFIPNLKATTAFPTPVGDTIDIKADTLLDNTDFALMGLFEAQSKRFGGFVDVMYFDLGVNKTATRDLVVTGVPVPLPITADAALDIKANYVMPAANVRLVSGRRGNIDVFGGVRRLEIDATLDYTLSTDVPPFVGPLKSGSSNLKDHNWDGVGGVRGQIRFGRLVVPYYADAGAGDSDLTWQVMGGLGVSFRHVDVGGVWRYLAYEMKDDRKLSTIKFNGPAAGVTFKW